MKFGAVLVALSIAAPVLAAQNTLTPAQAAPPKAAAETISIGGCVSRDATRTGSQTPFKLVKVEALPASQGSRAAGQPAETGYPLAESYWLDAPGSISLAPHVDHQIEVTGTVAPPAPVVSGGVSGRGAASDTTPTFKVTAFKMVAATCKS
jgi:hypothetical protein